MYEFDDLLEELGGYGTFQKRLIYGLFSYTGLLLPFLTQMNVFMVYTPDHWCNVQGREHYGVTTEEWTNITLPMEAGPNGSDRVSQCQIYSWSQHLDQDNITLQELRGKTRKGTSSDIMDCPERFGSSYDKSMFSNNLVIDFNWICHRSDKVPLFLLLDQLYTIIGSALIIPLADKFGRKLVFYWSLGIHTVGTIFMLFLVSTSDQLLWTVFALGIIFPKPSQLLYVLIVEYIIPAKRNNVNFITFIWWSVGGALVPLFGWLTKGDWRLCMGIIMLFKASLFLFFCSVKESPRWLIARGRTDEAITLMKHMAKVNKKSEPRDLQQKVQSIIDQELNTSQTALKVTDVMKWKKLLLRMIIICCIGATSNQVYDGVTLNLMNISGNPYLNSFVMTLFQFPSFILIWLLLDRIGRRWTTFMAMSLCSFPLLLVVFIPPGIIWISILSSTLAKSGGAMMTMVSYMYVIELAPTAARSVAATFPTAVSGVVELALPYIIELGKENRSVPFLIMGSMAGAAAFLVLLLPETANRNLPQTFEDANNLGCNQKFWSFNLYPNQEEENILKDKRYEKMNPE